MKSKSQIINDIILTTIVWAMYVQQIFERCSHIFILVKSALLGHVQKTIIGAISNFNNGW